MNPSHPISKAEARLRLRQISSLSKAGDFSWSYDEYLRLAEIAEGPQKAGSPLYLRGDEADTRRPRFRRALR